MRTVNQLRSVSAGWQRAGLVAPVSSRRSRRGSFLVEAVVATLIAAILGTALVDAFARIRRVSTESQDQLMATTVAQEVFDQLRALQFATVAANVGTHFATVNDTGAPSGDALFTRPLMRDLSNTYYSQGTGATAVTDNANLFHTLNNQVEVDVKQGASANTLYVTVIVIWSNGTGTHKYTSSTILARYGLNG